MNDKLKPNYSGFFIPVAIILGAALIIVGITKMLGSQTGYKRLVEDLNSKTFGNRWVAAYELSKYISTNSIPKEDIPWLVENLSTVYKSSIEPRTRNFVILALGSLKNSDAIPVLNDSLRDEDDKVKFNGVIALGNQNKHEEIDYVYVSDLLKNSQDKGLQQVAILLLSGHKKIKYIENIRSFLGSSDPNLKITSATALLSFSDFSGEPIIRALFNNEPLFEKYTDIQKNSLKENVFQAIQKMDKSNSKVVQFLNDVLQKNSEVSISTKAKQALLSLQNL